MSGQPVKTESDIDRFRNEYMQTLALQAQIDDMNLQANKVYLQSGQLPPQAQLPDTRTTAEKLADIQGLKQTIVADLRPIAEPQFAMTIVNAVEQSAMNIDGGFLRWFAQNTPEIVNQLSRKYKFGIAGDANDTVLIVSFLEAMYSDIKTSMKSVKSYINSSTSISGRPDVLSQNDFNQIIKMLEEVIAVMSRSRKRPLEIDLFILDLKHLNSSILNTDELNNLREVMTSPLENISEFTLDELEYEPTKVLYELFPNRTATLGELYRLYTETMELMPKSRTVFLLLDKLNQAYKRRDEQYINNIITQLINLFSGITDARNLAIIEEASGELRRTMNFIYNFRNDTQARNEKMLDTQRKIRRDLGIQQVLVVNDGPEQSIPVHEQPKGVMPTKPREAEKNQRDFMSEAGFNPHSSSSSLSSSSLSSSSLSPSLISFLSSHSPSTSSLSLNLSPSSSVSSDSSLSSLSLNELHPSKDDIYQVPNPLLSAEKLHKVPKPEKQNEQFLNQEEEAKLKRFYLKYRAQIEQDITSGHLDHVVKQMKKGKAVPEGIPDDIIKNKIRQFRSEEAGKLSKAEEKRQQEEEKRQQEEITSLLKADNERLSKAKQKRQEEKAEKLLKKEKAEPKDEQKRGFYTREYEILSKKEKEWADQLVKANYEADNGSNDKNIEIREKVFNQMKKNGYTEDKMGEIVAVAYIKYRNELDQKEFERLQKADGKGIGQRKGRPRGGSLNIKPKEPAFIGFGINEIDRKKLDNNILSIRRDTRSKIKGFTNRHISEPMKRVIKNFIGGSVPNFNDMSSLDNEEREYLNKIVEHSELKDRLSVPAPSKDQREKDFHNFEVMKGEILAGNDSKELIKKFKLLMIKLSRQNLLPKSEVQELMEDLTELGY